MSIKTSDNMAVFFLLSLIMHMGIVLVMMFAPELNGLLWWNMQSHAPVFVDVVELPPEVKGEMKKPKRPTRISDRDIEVAHESFVQAKPSLVPQTQKEEPQRKILEDKTRKETALKEAKIIETTPPKTIKRETIPSKEPFRLFPTDSRLIELSKLYEKQSPKGEIGKELSFDTSESKYQKYLLEMKRRIELFWDYPIGSIKSGEQGKLRVDFTVTKDGNIEDVKIVKSSNYPALDDAAITAIRLANPFNPFPKNFEIENVNIHASFEYSLFYR